MNILFLAVDVNLRTERGDGVHVMELASQLETLGHHVVRVTATSSGHLVEGNRHAVCPSSAASQVLFGRQLAARWADVIYERRTSPKLSWAISHLTRIPFVVEVNGVLSEERLHQDEKASQTNLSVRDLIRGRMLQDAARIVAVSAGIRSDLLNRYRFEPDHVVVVPNGANTTRFRPMNQTECRRQLGLDAGMYVILFAGNLAFWQGVDLLVQAAAKFAPMDREAKVLIVGDGPELIGLERRAASMGIADRVRFEGHVPHARVPEYISAADVCVAPFREGRKASPIKLFEYLSCGRPVVTSDTDEIGEFVRKTQSGIVVEPGNVNAFAAAIEWLLANPQEAEAMGRRGRAAVESGRSWRRTAQEVASVLERVLMG